MEYPRSKEGPANGEESCSISWDESWISSTSLINALLQIDLILSCGVPSISHVTPYPPTENLDLPAALAILTQDENLISQNLLFNNILSVCLRNVCSVH